MFDAEGLVDIDASGVEALKEILDSLGHSDITLVFAGLKTRLETEFGAADLTARTHFFPTVTLAVDWCSEQLGEEGLSGQQ